MDSRMDVRVSCSEPTNESWELREGHAFQEEGDQKVLPTKILKFY